MHIHHPLRALPRPLLPAALLLLAAVFPAKAPAQTGPDVEWVSYFGGGGNDRFRALVREDDGGFLAVGSYNPSDTTNGELYLVRADAEGGLLWERTHSSGAVEKAKGVDRMPDGGYVVAGYMIPDGLVNSDALVLRFDADGQLLWTVTYGGPAESNFAFRARSVHDGIIVSGITRTTPFEQRDAFLLKLTPDGETVWSQTYGGPMCERATALEVTSDGGYLIGGLTCSMGAGGTDAWLVRTTAQGLMLWQQAYGGAGDEELYGLRLLPGGDVLFAGRTGSSYDNSDSDVYVVRTDSEGALLDEFSYGLPHANEWAQDIRFAGGHFVIAGGANRFAMGSQVLLIGITPHGDLLWVETFGGEGEDEAYAIDRLPGEGFIVGGVASPNPGLPGDPFLMRLTPEGGTGVDGVPAAAGEWRLGDVYPNPFNGSATVMFTLPAPANVRLALYDLLGRPVAVLGDGPFPAGTSRFAIDATALPSGSYFLRAAGGGLSATRRVTVVR